MAPEGAGCRKLSQFVANHILRYIDGHVTATVMYADVQTHHLGQYRGPTGPRLYYNLGAGTLHSVYFFHQLGINCRAFFN
jgi:hypothetical protein